MILRLSKSEKNIDKTHEDDKSDDESNPVNENITNPLNDSTEKAIVQFRKICESENFFHI